MLMMLSAVPVRAESIVQLQIDALDRRLGTLENLSLDRRLTVLETMLMELKDDSTLHRLTMGGTGLLIAERVVSVVKSKKVFQDGQEQ